MKLAGVVDPPAAPHFLENRRILTIGAKTVADCKLERRGGDRFRSGSTTWETRSTSCSMRPIGLTVVPIAVEPWG